MAEQYLFQAANAERVTRGIPPLAWDASLYDAAVLHARQMAARESISHQYTGEADVAGRAEVAGAHFSVVAENVAEAPNAVEIHDAWMRSAHHRENLLDPRVNRVGIAVLLRGQEMYAVEDFDREVRPLSLGAQEVAVADLLHAWPGLDIRVADPSARQTCAMDTGYAGDRRPWFVMRFTTGELHELPRALEQRLVTGRYHMASVGACSATGAEPFTSYSLAILLFP